MLENQKLDTEIAIYLLNKKFEELNIDYFGLDLDDTLTRNRQVFGVAMIDACGYILFGIDWEYMKTNDKALSRAKRVKEEIMDPIARNLQLKHIVNPKIMDVSVIQTAHVLAENPRQENIDKALFRIKRIYTHDVPELYEGAVDAVTTLKRTGINLFLASHAKIDWTLFKLRSAGLLEFFEGNVWKMSVSKYKDDEIARIFKETGIDPKHTIFAGDNYFHDFMAIINLGGRGIWIDDREIVSSKDMLTKIKADTLPIPPGSIKIAEISRLINGILSLT